MKQKKALKMICFVLLGVLFLGSGVTIALRELQKAPVKGVLYFDTDNDLNQSEAYQFDLKNNSLQKVEVAGYSHISNVAPVETGFYCMGMKDETNQMYVLFCQGGKVKTELLAEQLVQHTSQRWIGFLAPYENGAVFRLPGNQFDQPALYYADFASGTVEPLTGTQNCGAYAEVRGGTVYFSKRDGKVYQLKGEKAVFLFDGANPLFIDDATFLYSTPAADGENLGLFTYNVTSGQSAPSELHYDVLKYHSGIEFNGGRRVVGDWLVGYEPGLLREWNVENTGKVTFTNLKTGRRVVLTKLFWRNAEHLTYAEMKAV